MKHFIYRHVFWVIVLLFFSGIVLFPVFKPGLIVTDDADWMVIRLSSFYQSFRDGQFPVRFLARLNYSYGYPVSNFLYPGFLYIGSFLHVLGLSFQSSVEAIIIGSVFFGSIGLFYWLRLYFSPLSSFFGAISFLVSPYLLYDVYIRGSVGEIMAISVWMFVLYSLESGKIWLYIPLLALLIISHNTVSLFYISILAILLLLKKYKQFFGPSFCSIGITAFFWIPALLEKRFVLFDTVSVSDPSYYFTASGTLLVHSFPFIFAAVCTLLRTGDAKQKIIRTFFFCLFIVTLYFSSSSSRFFWEGNLLRTFIQFPYRIFAVWLFIGPWFISYVTDTYGAVMGKVLAIISIIILIIYATPYSSAQSLERSEGFYTTNEGTTTVMNEYMPRWVSIYPSKRAPEKMEIFSGNADIDITKSSTKMIKATINAKEESIVQINTLYYPGWGALLDEKPITISYDNGLGLMRIVVPKGTHTLYMAFRETKSRFMADFISAVCIFIYVFIYLFPKIVPKYKRIVSSI